MLCICAGKIHYCNIYNKYRFIRQSLYVRMITSIIIDPNVEEVLNLVFFNDLDIKFQTNRESVIN